MQALQSDIAGNIAVYRSIIIKSRRGDGQGAMMARQSGKYVIPTTLSRPDDLREFGLK